MLLALLKPLRYTTSPSDDILIQLIFCILLFVQSNFISLTDIERDEIRDMVMTMVRRTIDPKININTEVDIACRKEYPNIMSYDYDLFLFGARCLMKEKGDGDVYFLEISSLLRYLDLKSPRELVIAATMWYRLQHNRSQYGGQEGIGNSQEGP